MKGSDLLIIERILRERTAIWRQIAQESDLGRLTMSMLASSGIELACYGAVLGASHDWRQALLSAVKLPLLFLITLAICLPTLYLFNLVFGARLSVRQALALVLTTVTVTSSLALAFAPISLFFLITAPHYAFYKLLNVAILALASLVGLRFLTGGMAALNAHVAETDAATQLAAPEPTAAPDGTPMVPVPVSPAPAPALAVAAPGVQPVNGPVVVAPGGVPVPAVMQLPGTAVIGLPGMSVRPVPAPVPARPAAKSNSMSLLYIWILLFGFVGTQLAWTLRPFVGSPDQPLQVFREINGNFYVDIVRTLVHLF